MMRPSCFRLILFGIFSGLGIGSAFAQSAAPSRVTPESFAPPPARASGAIDIPQVEPGAVPKGAETLWVTVSGVSVEGAAPEFQAAIAAAIAKVKGRSVTVKALYGVAAEIEAAYSRAGYVLTRVTVPPQKLVNGGVFKLIVVDGFIESIDDSAVPERQRAVVRARIASLIGVRGLTMVQIERRLLIAGDVPGVFLRSALTKGDQLGGARLVLEADWRPFSVSIGADNRAGYPYKNNEFPMQVSLNSLLGLGEQVYGSAITGPDAQTLYGGAPLRRIFGLGAIIPLGFDGWIVNPEYTISNTNPLQAASALQTSGVFERYALRSIYPIIRTRSENLNINGSFEAMNETQLAPTFGTAVNEDRLRIFTLGLDGSKGLNWNASLSGAATLTQGLDALGARDEADALASGIPLSRVGSRPDYSKIDGRLRYDQALPLDFTGALIVRGQQSFTGALPTAGQFSLDGVDGLSAFPIGTLNADSGVTVRGELAHPFNVNYGPWASVVSPYLFGAIGEGWLADPTTVESPHFAASAFGVGLRFDVSEPTTRVTSLVTLELGHSSSNTVAGPEATRLTASWTVKY